MVHGHSRVARHGSTAHGTSFFSSHNPFGRKNRGLGRTTIVIHLSVGTRAQRTTACPTLHAHLMCASADNGSHFTPLSCWSQPLSSFFLR